LPCESCSVTNGLNVGLPAVPASFTTIPADRACGAA
jgi:hypothetical protein